jgi:DNA-directed RNA polymerase specialized sigma24 family protein
VSGLLITKNFESLWRELQPQLEGALRARGTDPDTARDLVQEVAIRLMATETDFVDDEHLLRWCHLVGRRLAANHYRDQARLLMGVVPDGERGPSTEDVVSGRLAVSEVAAALAALSDEERASLLGGEIADTRQGRVTQAVRRHRARKRLLAMVSGVLGWLGGVPLIRRLLRPSTAALAVVPVVFLSLALTPSHSPHLERPPFVRPIRAEPVPAQVAEPSSPSTAARVHDVTTTAPAPEPLEPSPLAPLHGTAVPLPVSERSGFFIYGVRDEPLFCMHEDPALGTVCVG